MELIEKDIQTRGAVGIFLQTDNDKPAYSFYHKIGFGNLGQHVSLYKALSTKIVMATENDRGKILRDRWELIVVHGLRIIQVMKLLALIYPETLFLL